MKFMKLGSKPDSFQTDGDNIRYIATELATDIVVNIGDVKFYLHKFPLLSKSARLQKLVSIANEENRDEITIPEIPGGPAAFEICAKFCYGMIVTLNAYNVVAARSAAEYLEMYESIEKGNLIYKIEVFLNSSIFRSWKDSIIVLQTTKSFLPVAEELKIVSHCLDSIASKVSMDTSKVDWSYSYNRKKLPSENRDDPQWNGVVRKHQAVPKDWWVEDLCDLSIDAYKRVISTIKTRGLISGEVIGEALNAYALRKLPGFSKGLVQGSDVIKNRSLIEMIIRLLPSRKGDVKSGFLLQLLNAAIVLECCEAERIELRKRISQQLDEAKVEDLMIKAPAGENTTIYDIDLVHSLVEEFVMQERDTHNDPLVENDFLEIRSPKFVSDASKGMVARLVDGYLAEVARDSNLPISKFVALAEMVSGFSIPSHDGLYRAIDMFLKEHPGITKSEKKRICRLMDCRKLSSDACIHAVQNERLPLRVVVQVLFFEQVRSTSSAAGSTTPDLPGHTRAPALLVIASHGSSTRSNTTNAEDDWDVEPTADDIKALKGDLTSLNIGGKSGTPKMNAEKKLQGLLGSKRMFSKLWLNKEKIGEISSSDTSESPGSSNAEETKSTPSRSRRQSLS